MENKKVCVIVGVGPGNGAAFASRFAKEGYQLALLARTTKETNKLASELKNARAYECDVSNRQSVKQTFDKIKQEMGDVDVVVYNAGSGSWGTVEEITPEDFENSWRINAMGLLLVSQQVIPLMKKQGKGNIVIVGATSSRRGREKTAAFAPAKSAQRSLAESMAKHLGPQGIHVSLIIIDGVVNLPRTRERMPDKADDFFVKPEEVANTAFWLTQQHPSAWTFEVDVRPFGEKW
jgi:NAD(P)-dependent dehydrogenase (short-subunit alcohol dehydrogenase family)